MSAAVAVFGIALLAALLYAVLEKQAPAYACLLYTSDAADEL